eukprot:Skav210530  [mRNA]  locus=scaffold3045:280814:281131:- [translate_table: standard]
MASPSATSSRALSMAHVLQMDTLEAQPSAQPPEVAIAATVPQSRLHHLVCPVPPREITRAVALRPVQRGCSCYIIGWGLFVSILPFMLFLAFIIFAAGKNVSIFH